MDQFSTSESICCGKFLFSSDHVILASNGSHNANIQVHYSGYRNGISGRKKLSKVAELPLSGEATAMELCSISRLSKTYAALARTTGTSSVISMVDVLTAPTSASLNYNVSEDNIDVSSTVTSLSFQLENELLATAMEDGAIVVYDLNACRELCRISADEKRVNKVQFYGTNQLVSIGAQNRSQVKIWDLKTKNNKGSGAIVLTKEVSNKCFMPSSSSQKSPLVQYCSITVHPAQNKIFCGSETGSVVAWDLRRTEESNVVFKPHFTSVNEVVVHPTESNLVVTASADGTVKYFNHTDYRAAAIALTSSFSADEDKSGPFTTLLSSEASFTGLDVDSTGSSVLAYTGTGVVYKSDFY